MSEDRLSSSKYLVDIMSYLDHENVCRLMRVSKHFYDCIDTNWSKMRRQECDITMVKGHRDGIPFVRFDFRAFIHPESYDGILVEGESFDGADTVFSMHIYENRITADATTPLFLKWFITNKYTSETELDSSLALDHPIHDPLDAMGSLLDEILPRIQMANFAMKRDFEDGTSMGNILKPEEGKTFSEAELNVVLNAFNECDQEWACDLDFQLWDWNPLYEEITDAMGLDEYKFSVSSELFDLALLNNADVWLYLRTNGWNVPWIAQLVKEWRSGSRNVTSVVFSFESVTKMDSIQAFQKLCDELGLVFKVDSEDDCKVHSHFIKRKSDARTLYVGFDLEFTLMELY